MIFRPTDIPGVVVVELELIVDERGHFARAWEPNELAAQGLNPRVAQASVSLNTRRGTLRGMHYQVAPHEEAKLVSCPRGAIWDVAVDLRPDSPTRGKWTALELRQGSPLTLYIPEGVAHGYITLEDDSEVHYLVSASYRPDAARGVRWDDPALGITWPLTPSVINARDRSYPDFR